MNLLVFTQSVDKNDPILGFFHRWLEELAKHFSRIHVICLKEGVHALPPNVMVHSLGKEKGENSLKYVFKFYMFTFDVFSKIHVDFVFFHMGAIFNILAAPFFLVRNILGTRFYWWKTHGKVDHMKERLALFFCDKVFTAGSKSFNLRTDKVRTVGHAIDTTFFEPSSVTPYRGRCLMVGRIVPVKKIEVALKAIELTQDISLTIIGNADEKTYMSELIAYVEDHRLQNISFEPARQQEGVLYAYHNADVLLHPAYEAGLDKVVLEAMASGVIPLTSIPSFEEILSPFDLYVPPGDFQGYADRIKKINRMGVDERKMLVQKMRDIVIRNHSISTFTRRVFSI